MTKSKNKGLKIEKKNHKIKVIQKKLKKELKNVKSSPNNNNQKNNQKNNQNKNRNKIIEDRGSNNQSRNRNNQQSNNSNNSNPVNNRNSNHSDSDNTSHRNENNSNLSILQQNFKKKLEGARFRTINERLYTCRGEEAFEEFQRNSNLFHLVISINPSI